MSRIQALREYIGIAPMLWHLWPYIGPNADEPMTWRRHAMRVFEVIPLHVRRVARILIFGSAMGPEKSRESHSCTAFHLWRWGFWLRVGGYGLSVVQSSQFPPLFSERHGYRKFWRVAGFRIGFLTPTH